MNFCHAQTTNLQMEVICCQLSFKMSQLNNLSRGVNEGGRKSCQQFKRGLLELDYSFALVLCQASGLSMA